MENPLAPVERCSILHFPSFFTFQFYFLQIISNFYFSPAAPAVLSSFLNFSSRLESGTKYRVAGEGGRGVFKDARVDSEQSVEKELVQLQPRKQIDMPGSSIRLQSSDMNVTKLSSLYETVLAIRENNHNN